MDTHYHQEIDYKYSVLARGILGGAFTGIIATVFNLAFDIIYRRSTGYEDATFVNINSIIVVSMATLLVAGIAYAVLNKINGGTWIYIAMIIVVSLGMLFIEPIRLALSPFTGGVSFGMIIIVGVMSAFALPYIAEHPKLWG